MRRRMTFLTWTLVAVAIGFAVRTGATTLQSQPAQTSQREDVLPALLVEVRGLRAAMEQMASAGPRVQLALGRVQLQEQRVNTMIRRLESVHDAIAKAERTPARRRHRSRVSKKCSRTAVCHPKAIR